MTYTDRYTPKNSNQNLAYFDENWNFTFEERGPKLNSFKNENFQEYLKSILISLKIYFLSSYEDHEILDFLQEVNFEKIKSPKSLLDRVESIDIDDLNNYLLK